MKNWQKVVEAYSLADLQKLVSLKQHGKTIIKLEEQRDALIAKLAKIETQLEELGFAGFSPEAAIDEDAQPKRRGRKPGAKKAAAKAPKAPKAAKKAAAKRGRPAGSKNKTDVIEMSDVAAPAEAPKRRGRVAKAAPKAKAVKAPKAAKTEKTAGRKARAPKAEAVGKKPRVTRRRNGGPALIDEVRAIFAERPVGEVMTLDEILYGLAERGFSSSANAEGTKRMIITAIRTKAAKEIVRAGRGAYRRA